MENGTLDNKSFQFLKYIYENDECPVKKLPEYTNAKDITEMLPLHNTIFLLYQAEYLAVHNPELKDIMLSKSYEKYISACDAMSIGHLNPNCIICILPKGRAYVESKLFQQETLEKQLKALKIIADSTHNHAESAKKQSDAAILQAKSAKSVAKTAQESSESSTKYAKISAALSIIAIIISIVAIVLPLLCE